MFTDCLTNCRELLLLYMPWRYSVYTPEEKCNRTYDEEEVLKMRLEQDEVNKVSRLVKFGTFQERWDYELINDKNEQFRKRMKQFDVLGSQLDSAIQKAYEQAEEGAEEIGIIAPNIQHQEQEDEQLLADMRHAEEGQEDQVGRGDLAEDIGLALGTNQDIMVPVMVRQRNSDLRPIVASLNEEQAKIYNEVHIHTVLLLLVV